ncbi:MAG: HU family DNA-binding protein [Acidimicrobiales bacterium]|nr:HU family DNA-binding protein [Acidimicrobiales bacterium]
MANLSKSDTLNAVAEAAGVTKAQAEAVIDAFCESCVSAAKNGDKVSWPGFGSFQASHRAARTGRNPRTGEPVEIAASTGLKFTAAKAVKDSLN